MYVINLVQADLNSNTIRNVIRYVRLGTDILNPKVMAVLRNASQIKSMLKIIILAFLSVRTLIHTKVMVCVTQSVRTSILVTRLMTSSAIS